MKIEYHKGNILSVKKGYIFHGCNFRGVYNAGVARQIREKYPIAYQKYMEFINECKEKNFSYEDMYGSMSFAYASSDLIIGNVITQDGYGRDKQYVDYNAILRFLFSISMMPDEAFDVGVHIPKIGCGLAGGDWSIISKMIESVAPDDKTIHVWEKI